MAKLTNENKNSSWDHNLSTKGLSCNYEFGMIFFCFKWKLESMILSMHDCRYLPNQLNVQMKQIVLSFTFSLHSDSITIRVGNN